MFKVGGRHLDWCIDLEQPLACQGEVGWIGEQAVVGRL